MSNKQVNKSHMGAIGRVVLGSLVLAMVALSGCVVEEPYIDTAEAALGGGDPLGGCSCPDVFEEFVCANDGEVYGSDCMAECVGGGIASDPDTCSAPPPPPPPPPYSCADACQKLASCMGLPSQWVQSCTADCNAGNSMPQQTRDCIQVSTCASVNFCF